MSMSALWRSCPYTDTIFPILSSLAFPVSKLLFYEPYIDQLKHEYTYKKIAYLSYSNFIRQMFFYYDLNHFGTQNYWVFGLFPSSGILENTTFRKLELFPSSGEGAGEDTYSVGPLGPVIEISSF
jgi:hypothetical protein